MNITIGGDATLTFSMRCTSPGCSHAYALRDEPEVTEEVSPYAAPLRAGWRVEGGVKCPDHASDRVETLTARAVDLARHMGARS